MLRQTMIHLAIHELPTGKWAIVKTHYFWIANWFSRACDSVQKSKHSIKSVIFYNKYVFRKFGSFRCKFPKTQYRNIQPLINVWRFLNEIKRTTFNGKFISKWSHNVPFKGFIYLNQWAITLFTNKSQKCVHSNINLDLGESSQEKLVA